MTDWHCLDVAHAPTLHFDPNAQELFVAWLTELESKLRGIGLHPAFVSHLAKYRRLMPSLALLFHLADGGISSVSLQHAQQAAAWCEYLESHARRIYSMMFLRRGRLLLIWAGVCRMGGSAKKACSPFVTFIATSGAG